MNKWYHPFGLLLLAAMVGDLSGCAQTSGWLAKKPSKKASDEKLADAEKKPKDKTTASKKKTSSELADAKSAKPKDDKSAKAKTGDAKTKAVDAEHDKYAGAERLKKKKSPADPFAEDEKSNLVASSKPIKAEKTEKPKKSVSKAETSKPEDDLDLFLTKSETPNPTAKKKPSKKELPEDRVASADESTPLKKSVVQVKKEVAKGEADDGGADWAEMETQTDSKPVKSASIAESFEDELESPFAMKSEKSQAKPRESKRTVDADFTDESAEPPVATKKKTGIKKNLGHGLDSLCPDADDDLCDLLKNLDPTDPESLKQGLHRIGQLGREGVAATPVLEKLLTHEEPFVRAHAALAMARLKISTPESVAVVTDALRARNASLRSFGVAILDEMGPQANEVLTDLALSLKDRDGQVRLRAAEVLIHKDEFALPALQALLACLKDKDENVRWLTTYSLAELRPEDSPEVVQALMKAAHDRVPKVQAGAIYALGEIGPFAKRATDELRRLQESTTDDELKTAIDYALKQINP